MSDHEENTFPGIHYKLDYNHVQKLLRQQRKYTPPPQIWHKGSKLAQTVPKRRGVRWILNMGREVTVLIED